MPPVLHPSGSTLEGETVLNESCDMWNFFRRNKTKRFSLGDLPVHERAALLSRTLPDEIPNGRAQILIALENIDPIYNVTARRRKTEQPANEYTWENCIKDIEDGLANETDEVGKYRMGWFLFAAVIRSISKQAATDIHLHDNLARIYTSLADAAFVIPSIVEHNIIWSDDEKMYFRDLPFNHTHYVIRIMFPKFLRKNEIIQAYATKHEIILI